jgi:hypothetical protein
MRLIALVLVLLLPQALGRSPYETLQQQGVVRAAPVSKRIELPSCDSLETHMLRSSMAAWGKWMALQVIKKQDAAKEETVKTMDMVVDMVSASQRRTEDQPQDSSNIVVCQHQLDWINDKGWVVHQTESVGTLEHNIGLSDGDWLVATPAEVTGGDDSIWIVTNITSWKEELVKEQNPQHQEWYFQTYSLSIKEDMEMNDFCNGMFMTMAMGGFQWSLFKKGDCLNYFVAPWQLKDRGTFKGAMMYSFLLALLTEGLSSFQAWVRQYLPAHGLFRKTTMGLLYAMQQWMGYIIMLITMMYSFELFSCVIAGVMVGHYFFPHPYQYEDVEDRPRRGDRRRVVSSRASVQNRGEEEAPLLGGEASIRRRRQ